MDIDGFGWTDWLMNGHKQRGTEDELENGVYLLLHGSSAFCQSGKLILTCSVVSAFILSAKL